MGEVQVKKSESKKVKVKPTLSRMKRCNLPSHQIGHKDSVCGRKFVEVILFETLFGLGVLPTL